MPSPRFLTLDDVAEILNVSWSQAYALVRRRELIAIQIGGRGQWRVEVDELERFIQQKYAEARAGAVPAADELTAASTADEQPEAPVETSTAAPEPAPARGRRRG
ncbi:transcriptional regulator, AlpA family [Geodermatophilus dictyosporus]|uniref:Transcriptional regulator, AlpA family n=1 Tax=Geodermatophilus dictyosporus TaxID=1523247 RepID=A0A1I5L7K0_9ACTN|nr:helix-turn-helix domain-containing protein [Geodermatophilus dictyosporus]SFO93260.1 transcriptional regulator, AlpA family [Geodermatophilus dictyosporus]